MNESREQDAAAGGDDAPREPTAGQDDQTGTDDVFVEDVVVDSTGDAGGAAQTDTDAAPQRRWNPFPYVFAVIAVAAVAAAGYFYYEQRNAAADAAAGEALAASLESRLDAVAERLDGLQSDTASASREAAAAAADTATLGDTVERRLQRLEALNDRLSNLENSVASLQGISAGSRDRWLLAEAEYYLQLANAQLNLARNPTLAALALEMADERIVKTSNPALTEVRAAIADELAALEVMETADIEGLTLTLSSLARVVDSLPLRNIEDAEAPSGDDGIDPELTGVRRAWASVREAASGLVRVTPPDEARAPLMTPKAESLLRSNLALNLQAARLALLRGERAVFEQSLDDADAWLGTYFDPDSTQVSSVRETIAEVRGSVFSGEAPDISESLRLLRQFNTLSGSEQ